MPVAALRQKLLARIHRKRLAYQRVFLDGQGNLSPEGARVLKDLKRFCGINRGGLVVSPVSRIVDSHATTYRAGARDTYLRIAKFLELDETDINEVTDDDAN